MDNYYTTQPLLAATYIDVYGHSSNESIEELLKDSNSDDIINLEIELLNKIMNFNK